MDYLFLDVKTKHGEYNYMIKIEEISIIEYCVRKNYIRISFGDVIQEGKILTEDFNCGWFFRDILHADLSSLEIERIDDK